MFKRYLSQWAENAKIEELNKKLDESHKILVETATLLGITLHEKGLLQKEVNILRRGCDRVKVLDNPAMRWIHRALRDADRVWGEDGHRY